MNAGCSSGSPPETVSPPPAAPMNRRYRPARASTSAALIRRPVRPNQVSGLWQYTQRSGQPAVNTTNRVPGPSTPVEMSQECTEPVTVAGVGRPGGRLPQAGGAGGRHGHTEPWKVRFTTSSCCSRVSRTKLTAYPETRIVSCG